MAIRNRFLFCACWYVLSVSAFAFCARSVNVSAGSAFSKGNASIPRDFRIVLAAYAPSVLAGWRTENPDALEDALRRVCGFGGIPEWMAEYGENLLRSCGRDAILFTGSLVDTNAAWYVQFVLRKRPDVSVIPLGFLDQPWFVSTVRSMHGIHPGWKGWLPEPGGMDSRDFLSGSFRSMPDTVLRPFHALLRDNAWKRPVYLSSAISPEFTNAMADRIQVSGCAFRLMPRPSDPVDLPRTREVFSDTGRFRALIDAPVLPETDEIVRTCLAASTRLLMRTLGSRDKSRLTALVRVLLEKKCLLGPDWEQDIAGGVANTPRERFP
jgi:hypothetical protein